VGQKEESMRQASGDNNLMGISSGHRCSRLRQPRPRQRLTTGLITEPKVRNIFAIEERVGTEEEDDVWHVGVDCEKWLIPDPAADLRPMGFQSKFWSLEDEDDPVITSQSPFTPDLVRQAAVHGFSKEQLVEVEIALNDSSIRRRVEASMSPTASDKKVVLVRNIFEAWGRRSAVAPWVGILPPPRRSPSLTRGLFGEGLAWASISCRGHSYRGPTAVIFTDHGDDEADPDHVQFSNTARSHFHG
jgi:hypothetical protein